MQTAQPVSIDEKALPKLRLGHPWIYAQTLTQKPKLELGELVSVISQNETFATAFADPSSPLLLRILYNGGDTTFDLASLLTKRINDALFIRRKLLTQTQGLRLVHGEGDYMPGLVIDKYGDRAIFFYDGNGAEAFWHPRASIIIDALRALDIGLLHFHFRRRDKTWIDNPPPKETLWIREHDLAFGVDLLEGQKTGLFFDHRANRQYIKPFVKNKTVLNLFSYTGGFSLSADKGGAKKITSVDIAKPAIDSLRENISKNNFDNSKHELQAIDAWKFLEKNHKLYDVIVCDPPSMARSKRQEKNALRAYVKLHSLAMSCLKPGGTLFAASCSSHVNTQMFSRTLAEAAKKTRRSLKVVSVRGADSDHPLRAGFPEGDYLSFLHCVVE